jgi:Omp85 superfamily domain
MVGRGGASVAVGCPETLEADSGMARTLRRGAGESSTRWSIVRRSVEGLARAAATALVAAPLLLWAQSAAGRCDEPVGTKVIPLPVWATLPNEGSTWGVMPVFLRVCPTDRRTESIIAPSATWNSVIHYTGTLRWYHYPSDDTTFTLIASVSTHVNYNALAWWQRLPPQPGLWTDELILRLQRSVFFRFFGLGPDTPSTAETSYTGLRTFATARRGLNLARSLNLGVSIGIERDGVEAIGVPGLPLAPAVFPDTPGMDGATLLWQGLSLRYDDRRGGDYAERGLRMEVAGAIVEGLAGSPTFFRAGAQANGIIPELPRVTGAARIAWAGVSSGKAPFYQQSKLGGSFLLRGFTLDRFVDRQAWTAEVEQRIRLFRTHIFGVFTDWRVDPFVAAGQVFGPLDEAFSRPQLSVGLGLRALVRPNVLGRIDLAAAGEGLKVYVEIGYPY